MWSHLSMHYNRVRVWVCVWDLFGLRNTDPGYSSGFSTNQLCDLKQILLNVLGLSLLIWKMKGY